MSNLAKFQIRFMLSLLNNLLERVRLLDSGEEHFKLFPFKRVILIKCLQLYHCPCEILINELIRIINLNIQC